MTDFPYIFRWDRCGRKGQLCRVFARSTRWLATPTRTGILSMRAMPAGSMNSVGLEFQDGFRMVTSGNSLRRA